MMDISTNVCLYMFIEGNWFLGVLYLYCSYSEFLLTILWLQCIFYSNLKQGFYNCICCVHMCMHSLGRKLKHR